MRINHKLPHFFASTGDPSPEKITFDCSRHDIEEICRFFSLGKLRHYEKEKGISFAHFNSFVFVETARGQYALKFYTPDPTNTVRSIAVEYALNRILTDHHFLTPLMHAGVDGKPSFRINGRLAACYSYIDGPQACQAIKQRNVFSKINTAMFSLKNILSTATQHLDLSKEKSLVTTINALVRDSKRNAYDQKELIDAFLLDACRTYQHHQRLFTRQLIHSNTHIDNFLIHKKNIYTLDLSHVQEDYILTDLRGVVISCLFLGMPATKIKTIIKDYFTRHRLGARYFPVIDTLVKIMLIKEYLNFGPLPHLSKRKRSIIAALKRMNSITRHMV